MSWLRSGVLVCLVSLVLTSMLSTRAAASGFLVARDGSAALRLRSQRVTAVVDDGFARTTVRQTFVQVDSEQGRRPLEAVYAFPVPEGAALVDLALELGDQRLEGLLAERKAARRAYDAIVGTGKDPAIVEQIGRAKFRLSVFPVLPDQPTTVELTWIESVPRVDGELRYVYPLAMAGPDTTTEHDLTVSVTLRSSATIGAATSPTDGVAVERISAHEVRASLERSGATLDEDVVLAATVRSDEPSLAVHVFRPPVGEAYFAAVLTPPDLDEERLLPRDVTLAIDVSGSMKGTKIAQAKAAALGLLDGLRPRDRVNVLTFSAVVKRFADRPARATPEVVQAVREFVEAAHAKGSTALGDAIRSACAAPVESGRVSTVVLLTDGRPTVGEQDPATIIGLARDAAGRGLSVYTFGVGGDVSGGLLDGVAAAGGGTAEVFRPEGEIATRLRRFLARTGSPAIADLVCTVGGREVDDRFPRPLPPVYLGEQVWLVGRVAAEGSQEVRVRGTLDGEELVISGTVDFGRADARVPRGAPLARELYARTKLTFLERALRLRSALADDAYYKAIDRGAYSTADEVVAAAVDVSLDTGVQCAYTSFLALLPEDKARLDARDAAALDDALQRANARRFELAGVEEETHGDVPAGEVAVEVATPQQKMMEGKSINDVIGVGGGAGGSFGGRYAGRGSGRGGGRASQKSVEWGLEWLKRHQDPRGSWSCAGFSSMCETNRCDGAGDRVHDVGVTGLALVAFLGSGNTVNHGRYKDVVRKGLKFLLDVQDQESGCFVAVNSHQPFLYDHALATLAMTEAYGLSKWPILKEPAQKAIDFIHAARNPYKAWRYAVPPDGNSDLAVTGWMVMCLRSAQDFGLKVDPAALEGAERFIDEMTDPLTWRAGYLSKGGGSSRDSGMEARWPTSKTEAMTAVAMLCRVFMGEDPEKSPALRGGADLLRKRPPQWDEAAGTIDYSYWYYGSYAMFQVGGRDWNAWQGAMLEAVVKTQRQDGDERGSWDPQFDPWGHRGGRVYATAIMTLTLQVYYRYDRVVGAR